MQEESVMELVESDQEVLEIMDHKSSELLALPCGVVIGWWLWGCCLYRPQ